MTEQNIRFFPADTLVDFMKDVFVKLDVPIEDAEICADVLIRSDLRGIESHGCQRLKMYYDRIVSGIQSPKTQFKILKETATTARIDAGHGMGHVAAYRGMQLAIKKAKEFGTGAVSVGNSTHYGIAGYYSLMAIKEGMIGITCTNARPSIAPTYGVDAMMGTNPLTIGIPTDEEFPFLIDCATSITQRGKIEVKARTNSSIPEGWVITNQGNLATDSGEILGDLIEGTSALLPLGGAGEILGGHKGYGYAAAVEILSAALSNGPFMKELTLDKGYKLGHFFMAIDVEGFLPLNTFKKISGSILRQLRGSKKAPGHNRIYTAGEKEYLSENEREKTGIPIMPSILEDLKFLQNELKLSDYPFL
ncbi:MAG: Ldh family oxidoreductase [Candidatus Hodarchaeales archaeon]|jgi:LDH2 family malate/lactate/ureidoglycolate dehydrogenase